MYAAGLSIQDNTITPRVTRRNLIYLAGASLCQSIRGLPCRWCSCRECSAVAMASLTALSACPSLLWCATLGSGGAGEPSGALHLALHLCAPAREAGQQAQAEHRRQGMQLSVGRRVWGVHRFRRAANVAATGVRCPTFLWLLVSKCPSPVGLVTRGALPGALMGDAEMST